MSEAELDLLEQIKDQIGIDAYHIYPESRHAIPDAVLWGFASACFLEFVKTFVDFKGLGEDLRRKAETLLSSWFRKTDFPAATKEIDHTVLAKELLLIIPAELEDSTLMEATDNLASALEKLGVRTITARRHATAIADIISDSLRRKSQL